MPELPEVESVRRQLAPLLTGRVVVDAWRDPYPSARLTDVERVVGRRVEVLDRRGKFLVAGLGPAHDVPPSVPPSDPPLELVLHLGMSGSLRIASADTPEIGHLRARLFLDDGSELWFRDPRRFGRVSVVPAGVYDSVIPTLATLGPEPLTAAFDVATFAATLATGRAPVKARLLDQRVVAGVGNIYADESLWRARIHPASRRVGPTRAARLHGTVIEVLTAAIEREGTTFRDHRMVNGASGRYAQQLDVYGRSGTPCHRCGTTLRHTTVAQRGTTYCPACQRW